MISVPDGAKISEIAAPGATSADLSSDGKTVAVTFRDMNTFMPATPALSPGAQQLIVTCPNGDTVSLDAAFIAN